MAKPAFLFDLDMTLLDTFALLGARDRGEWGFVFSNLHLAKPFSVTPEPLPQQLPAILHRLGHPVAIVTSSPRAYAQKLLQAFQVHHDVLVGYEDTVAHKPSPAPLQEALKRLGVAPADAYYVGDAKEDMAASTAAGLLSIGAGWNPAVEELWKTAPDIFLHHPGLLQRPDLLPRMGYLAEVLTAQRTPLFHYGSVLRCGSPNNVALGRYYPMKDARSANDLLTQRLLKLKGDDEPSEFFGGILGFYIIKGMKPQPTFATCVPPKPSQKERVRFAKTLQHAKTYVPNVAIYPDGMFATREVENYKHTKPEERRALVKGAFASKYSWGEKTVLLLDDVFTSGSTTDECSEVLIANKASSVHTVCLTVDQEPSELRTCPRCARVLKVYRRGWDKKPFWGCPGKFKDGCPYTTDFITNVAA